MITIWLNIISNTQVHIIDPILGMCTINLKLNYNSSDQKSFNSLHKPITDDYSISPNFEGHAMLK